MALTADAVVVGGGVIGASTLFHLCALGARRLIRKKRYYIVCRGAKRLVLVTCGGPLMRVTTADGRHGIGFCYSGSRAGMLVTYAVRELFAPLLQGRSALDVEGSWRAMYEESLLQGRARLLRCGAGLCRRRGLRLMRFRPAAGRGRQPRAGARALE